MIKAKDWKLALHIFHRLSCPKMDTTHETDACQSGILVVVACTVETEMSCVSSEMQTPTCSAKKEMMVKMTSVTRTQWVQNFSLSRYNRLGQKTVQLVLNKNPNLHLVVQRQRSNVCFLIGWQKCLRWHLPLERRLAVLWRGQRG